MKFFKKNSVITFILVMFLPLFVSNQAWACACGCGIFNVGTSSLIQNQPGGLAFVGYDYMNQNHNWHKENKAAAANNEDKQIKSQILTIGAQYMFDRNWGANIRIPYLNRSSKMLGMHDGMMGMDHHEEMSSRVNSIGDINIGGIYSGFFSDMSTGISFGLKLPTGKTNAKSLDSRDMQIGTGSIDWLLGAYNVRRIDDEGRFNWFVQGNWQHAFINHNGYNPGDEFSASTGASYDAGGFSGVKRIAPILQVKGSKKLHDTGWASDPKNTGYSQVYFAPAFELTFDRFKAYADIAFPLYQNTNGNQLVANRIYKLIIGYNF